MSGIESQQGCWWCHFRFSLLWVICGRFGLWVVGSSPLLVEFTATLWSWSFLVHKKKTLQRMNKISLHVKWTSLQPVCTPFPSNMKVSFQLKSIWRKRNILHAASVSCQRQRGMWGIISNAARSTILCASIKPGFVIIIVILSVTSCNCPWDVCHEHVMVKMGIKIKDQCQGCPQAKINY